MQHIADDYETDGEWYEFDEPFFDDFDDTIGPIGIGTTVRATGFPGVACRVYAYDRDGDVIIRMVGDDHNYTVELDTLTIIEDDVCSCGQLGCSWASCS